MKPADERNADLAKLVSGSLDGPRGLLAQRPRLGKWGCLLVGFSLVMACSRASTSSTTSPTTGSPPTSSIAAVAPSTAVPATTTELVLDADTSPVETAGTYQVEFVSPFSVTMPDGWRGEALSRDFVFFEWAGEGFEGEPLVAVQSLAGVFDPLDASSVESLPSSLATFILGHPGLSVSTSEPVTVAGLPALAIVGQVTGPNFEEEDGPRLLFGFTDEEITVFFTDQTEVQFIVVVVEGERVLITVEAACCDQLDKMLSRAEELIASIRFEGQSIVTATATAVGTGEGWTELRPLGGEGTVWPFAVANNDSVLIIGGLTDLFADSAEPIVLLSADGEAWELLPTPPPVLFLAAATHDAVIVGVGESDPTSVPIWTSTDGRDWQPNDDPAMKDYILTSVSSGADGFIALGDRFVDSGGGTRSGQGELWPWRSADGLTWSRGDMIHGPEIGLALDAFVAATTDGWLALVNLSNEGASVGVWQSADGASWTRAADGEGAFRDAQLNGVAAGLVGLVAYGQTNSESNDVWVSALGEEWLRISSEDAPDGFVNDIVATSSGFLAVGGTEDGAAFWESADGSTWERTWESEVAGVAPMAALAKNDQMVVVGLGEQGELVVWAKDSM